jgi:hypothetical protein
VRPTDRIVKCAVVVIAVLLALQALRSFVVPAPTVLAQSARFDDVTIMSADPVFVMRMQFEKIDQDPR